MIGTRVTFTDEIRHKRCMTIEIEYEGTVRAITTKGIEVEVDTVDGMSLCHPILKVRSYVELGLEDLGLEHAGIWELPVEEDFDFAPQEK